MLPPFRLPARTAAASLRAIRPAATASNVLRSRVLARTLVSA